MQVNSISDVIIAIALAAIPVIGAWIGKVITGHSKATTLINVLSPLAKAAIVAMQKLGATQYLEGEAKKSGAVDIVKKALLTLGLSNANETLIKNAIEKEYAVLINELNQTYPQMTAEQAKAQEAATQQASELAKVDAQAKINSLQN